MSFLVALLVGVGFPSATHPSQAGSPAEVLPAAIRDLNARPADYVRQQKAAEALTRIGPAAEPALPALIGVIEQPFERVGGDVMSAVPGFEEAIEAARRAVLAIGPMAVPKLIDRLRHAKGESSPHGITLLGALNDARALAPLVEAIGVTHSLTVETVLSESKLPGVSDAVAARLGDPDPRVRSAVVTILIGRRDQRALPSIVQTLERGNPHQRWESVGRLANLKPPDVRERLQGLLKDSDAWVRSEAASRLGDVGNSLDVPALIEALSDAHARVRWGAARALGLLKDRRGLMPLRAALKVETDEGNRQAMQASIQQIAGGA
jgi:hypothetical protein